VREQPSIVLIGAGSSSFGLTMLHDIYSEPLLGGSTLWLVDLDLEKAERMRALAARLEAAAGRGIDVRTTADRCEALPGADAVIISTEVDRLRRWLLDFEIPRRHGVQQIYGENGGPGGMSHALRTIPLVAELALDAHRLAPDALIVNFSNPEGRVCTALRRHHPDLPVIGLCHEVRKHTDRLATHLGSDSLRWRAAGLNHITWLLEVGDTTTGEDLTPKLGDALEAMIAGNTDDDTYELVRFLHDRFGTVVATSDSHVGEYFPFAHEHVAPIDVEARQKRRSGLVETVVDHIITDADMDLEPFFAWRSDEAVLPIMRAAITREPERIASAILPNDGLMPALPRGCAVEVSATATGDGIVGDVTDDLPAPIAGVLNLEVAIQQLTGDAALTGSRDAALEALLIDPVVASSSTAAAVLDDLEAAHAGAWPPLH